MHLEKKWQGIVPASGGIGCYMGTQGIDIKKFLLETEERYK